MNMYIVMSIVNHVYSTPKWHAWLSEQYDNRFSWFDKCKKYVVAACRELGLKATEEERREAVFKLRDHIAFDLQKEPYY